MLTSANTNIHREKSLFRINNDDMYVVYETAEDIIFRMELWIDPFATLSKGAQELELCIFTMDPASPLEDVRTSISPQALLSKINTAPLARNNLPQRNDKIQLVEKKFDLTCLVSNTVGMEKVGSSGILEFPGIPLTAFSQAGGIDSNSPNIPSKNFRKSKRMIKKMDPSNNPKDYQIFSALTYPGIFSENISASQIYKLYMQSIFKEGMDPVSAFDFPFPVSLPKNSLMGLRGIKHTPISELTHTIDKVSLQKVPLKPYTNAFLCDSFYGSTAATFTRLRTIATSRKENDRQPAPFGTTLNTPSYVPFVCDVAIEKSDINRKSNLFFQFKLRRKNGTVIQIQKSFVGMSQKISLYRKPKIAPTINVKNIGPGRARVRVQQNDRMARRVEIYKKVIRTTYMDDRIKYTMVMQKDLQVQEGTLEFVDYTDSDSPVIYRAVSA